jgi:mRNA-degrading endonuclease RelE of RelBE toxin-antitoxin system
MISFITDDFLKHYSKLPKDIQNHAKKCYKSWKDNPFHPSLQFKQIHPVEPIWSVRISRGWRVLGLRDKEKIYWFWIGTHNDYDNLINSF